MSKRPQAEAERGSVLNQLKAYRRANPTFQQDKDALISAEAEFGASDPMEGVTYKVARRRSPTSPKAPSAKEKAASGIARAAPTGGAPPRRGRAFKPP